MLKLKTVFIAIGTNKGDREKNISIALKLLSDNKQIKLLKVSKMLKNPPQEGIKSGYFLNGTIKLLTSPSPSELKDFCKKIERKLGRREKTEKKKKTSRTIDLDILFYEDEIINTEELTIPHSMLHKRYFVLIPLLEIGENFVHPVFKKTIGELYSKLTNIKKYA